jgi:hypothetical protein
LTGKTPGAKPVSKWASKAGQPWRTPKPGSKPVPPWGRWTGGKRPGSTSGDGSGGSNGGRSGRSGRGGGNNSGGGKLLPFRRPVRRGRGTMVNPYRPAIEGLAGRISTENARRVMDYVAGLPELIQAASDRLRRDGAAYVDDFPSDARAGEVAVALGVQMAKMHDPVAKFAAVFARVHAKELDRLENPRQQEEKWDVSKNQG